MDPQGHVEHLLFSTLLPEVAQNPSRLHPSLCLPSWSRGGQECLDGWFLVVPMDPGGHGEHLLFSTLLPEVALNPSKPIKTPPILMLFNWSCGGQECLDGWFLLVPMDPQGHGEH